MKEPRRKRAAQAIDADAEVVESSQSSPILNDADFDASKQAESSEPVGSPSKRRRSSISTNSLIPPENIGESSSAGPKVDLMAGYLSVVEEAYKHIEILNQKLETQYSSEKIERGASAPSNVTPTKLPKAKRTTRTVAASSRLTRGLSGKTENSDAGSTNALPVAIPSQVKSPTSQGRGSQENSDLATAKDRSLKLHYHWIDALHTNKILVSMSTAIFQQEVTIRGYNDVFSMNFGLPLQPQESVSPGATPSTTSAPAPTVQENEDAQDISLTGQPLRRIIGDRGYRNNEDEIGSGIGCPSSPRILANIMHSMTSGLESSFYCALQHQDGLPILCYLQCVPLGRGGARHVITSDNPVSSSSGMTARNGTKSSPEVCWAMLNIHAASLAASAIQQGVGFGLPLCTFRCNEIVRVKDAPQTSKAPLPTLVEHADNGNKGTAGSKVEETPSLSLENPCPMHDRAFGLLRLLASSSTQL